MLFAAVKLELVLLLILSFNVVKSDLVYCCCDAVVSLPIVALFVLV